MSVLTVLWSMVATASFTLGLAHLAFWFNNRKSIVYLLSSIMAISAAASAMLELGMSMTESLDTYAILIRFENLVIYFILVPMVWFVQINFGTGKRWLAIVITVMWSCGMVINFLPGQNLTFSEIHELKQFSTFWGENFSVPVGTENPWKIMPDIASLLILVYVADASLRLWRQGRRRSAVYIGGGIVFFITAAGIHAPLVDSGVVQTPYMISFAFLAIVVTMSYQLLLDAIHARGYERELQKTRQTLDQLSRSSMLGECTTMIAHELNQPLTAILSNAQAALRYLDSGVNQSDEIRDILDDIVRDDKRASDIIHHLRRMVQKEEAIREPVDLNAAILEVIEVLSRDIEKNGIKLDARLSEDVSPVWAGRVEIQQVVLNFLTNAIRTMSDGRDSEKRITIRTSRLKGEVQVEVEDTGCGISSDIESDVFNSFIGDSSDGMGLGLAISRRIIEACGGRIAAANREGGGAVFSFSLPVS